MIERHATRQGSLRRRDGHHAHVTNEELFFDLVYAFAVTQLSHQLLHHLTGIGLIETLVLWFAVWLGWQYTCWFTNWFDPETPRVRHVLFFVMLLALIMACSIPTAFGTRGLVFAGCYAAIQVGRTAFAARDLGRRHELAANHRRMLGWLCISAVFWLAGGLLQGPARLGCWIAAIACEYISPMIGFALPLLGRSRTSEWTIEGGHLAERCQLFVIVALGETLLSSGATLAEAESWSTDIVSALLATFIGTLAMWWLYFGTSSKHATTVITTSGDPGRIGASFHYIHAILVAGIIGTAVGNDLVLAHPRALPSTAQLMALAGGPALYLLGSAAYKRVVYGCVPASHVAGAALLLVLALLPANESRDLHTLGWLTTAVLVLVSCWEMRVRRQPRTEARDLVSGAGTPSGK
jgi:low temperature requirement protein LtrA